MDNRILMDLARQFGLPQETAGAKAKEYMGKSDEEILQELSKVKKAIKRDPRTYQQQIQAVKALAASMNGPQKARLEKIIGFLES